MKKTFIFVILALIIYGCSSSENNQQDKLIGVWIRIGDTYRGAKVIVDYDKENKLQGWLGYVPDSMALWNFRQFEIKWLDLNRESNNRYSLRSLVKLKRPGWLQSVLLSEYHTATLQFLNNDTICIESLYGDPQIDLGLRQYWVRWWDIK
jgi:hypothetical protein